MHFPLRRHLPQIGLIGLAIFTFILAVILPLPSLSQASLSDIQGHWAQGCIQQLAQRRVISGYPDGTFRPNNPVTRAEFAAIVTNAFPNAPVIRDKINFGDVADNYWATRQINRAYQTGFLSGYPNRTFKPTQNIPRVQVLVALAAGLQYRPSLNVEAVLNYTFADGGNIPNYAQNGVAAAAEKGLVVNYPQVRQLQPNQLASRAQVAAFVCQALEIDNGIASRYIANPQAPEIRGVWLTNIDSDVLYNGSSLTAGINQLAELNFNTIYPAIWNNGYTLYPSSVAERETGTKVDPEPGLRGRDMLQEAIVQGHGKNMAVIPWFEFGFMAPADSQLAQRHPDWLVKRRDGGTIWLEGGVLERVWLNPLHPEVQQFITDLVVEIVGNYDVDGIQFDDHFGYPADFGYDDFTVQLYQQEHNGNSPPADAQNSAWIRWRADKITQYMEQLFWAIKAKNQQAIVALSPNPQDFSLEAYLLDWQTWERKGFIEELIVQVYRNDQAKFAAHLQESSITIAKDHIPVGIGILSGLKPRPVPWQQIETQAQIVRNQGLAGMSFFFYESLWNLTSEPAQERKSQLQKLFAIPVKRG